MSTSRSDGFADLGSYGLLGDMRSSALVAEDGAVDWLALPTLDSAPVCAALLDPARGGSIALSPSLPYEVSRHYVPETMVLETTYTTAQGTMRVTDALNLGDLGTLPWTELARVVEVDGGPIPVAWSVAPGHRLSAAASPWAYRSQDVPMLLVGDHHLAIICEGLGEAEMLHDSVRGECTLPDGASGLLAVVAVRGEPLLLPTPDAIRERVAYTTRTWQHWSGLHGYRGRWRAEVTRSALTLKALTSKSTGAIAAAATTSLPEQPGGERNFDYRYAWIRDGAFALDAMSRLGLSEELHTGIRWMLDAVATKAPELWVFYGLDGEPASAEMTEVADVPGYRQSLPVNVGNAAASQTQLGAYGHLLDAVWHYHEHGGRLTAESASMLSAVADHLCDIWPTRDAGLWELGSPEQYTSSKLGCWTALDRAIRLAERGQVNAAHTGRWRAERDRIRAWIEEHCWSQTKRSYTFYAGTDELDAAVLLMARFGYLPHDDVRLGTTIDAIMTELLVHDALVYRYSGQQDTEGAFLACTCWLVEALVHVGRVGEAEQIFTDFLTHAGSVGLLTEEIDPPTGQLLGNLPQALSHLGLITAATALDAALDAV